MPNPKNLEKHKWPKGTSGNPAGKPKGTKHISTYIQDLMTDESFTYSVVDKQGKKVTYKGAPMEAIIKVAMSKASQGEVQWAEWLAKHGWRKEIDITTDGNPLPTPIYGGLSVQEYDSDPEDISS